MPQLIQHIDAIARQQQRDVLYVQFTDPSLHPFDAESRNFDWRCSEKRKNVVAWLEEKQISWFPCGHFANTSTMRSYEGQIYIDATYDEEDPVYQRILVYLENPDGSIRLPGVWFCVMPLRVAMKNAHHDEPGFWEKWAENF